MSSESSSMSAATAASNESKPLAFHASHSRLIESDSLIPATISASITRAVLERSASPSSDLDSLLVAELAKLPPGDRLHEAWQQGPEALYAFLNARWVEAMKNRAPERRQIRLDRDPDRMRILAELRNDE